ncbi:hypothetical protein HPP92_028493 [Vanilla planifolia]|uniref:Kinesin motor domain-containing protein n=1 Tax=Vanilla planifolia TaxID=51239 RepID=A0A835P726_VANPL|nr:hypothetical protein HPP92_028493 [Vanilla planifolia]
MNSKIEEFTLLIEEYQTMKVSLEKNLKREESNKLVAIKAQEKEAEARVASKNLRYGLMEDLEKATQEINHLNSQLQADAIKNGDTISKLQKEKNALVEIITRLTDQASLLRNQLENMRELKGNIRVFCRVRPFLSDVDARGVDGSVISYPTSIESLGRGIDLMSVGKTQMNEQSSRSHFVFTLRISGVNVATEQQVQGVLNLIDLARSELLAKSGSIEDHALGGGGVLRPEAIIDWLQKRNGIPWLASFR